MGETRFLLNEIADSSAKFGVDWLGQRRVDAVRTLKEQGLPHKKTEAWRFTPTAELQRTRFMSARVPTNPDALIARVQRELGPDDGTLRIIVVDGAPQISALSLPKGVRVSVLEEAIGRDETLQQSLLQIANSEHFSALNAIAFQDGVLIDIEKNATVELPIHLVHISSGNEALTGDETPTLSHPRVLVRAGINSAFRLVETVLGAANEAHMDNLVVELDLDAGARVDHVRVHQTLGKTISSISIRQGRNSHYASHVITMGGKLLRSELHIHLSGEGAECNLDGAYFVANEDHVDHRTVVEHHVPRGTSRQRYRGVVDNKGTAVFDGIVIVHPNAQKTEAHQENRNLLLSESARVHTKPHLEIEADDVKCSHGATVGTLDQDQLFYLRARGVPNALAKNMLTLAFVRSIAEGIVESVVADRVDRLLTEAFSSGEALKDEA
ncbi:MAG: Fe-S cluster assembly protein SufD [Polyangiales bacterium]